MEDKVTKLERTKFELPWIFGPLPDPSPAISEEAKDREVRLRHRSLLPDERINLFKTRTNTNVHATICVFRQSMRANNNTAVSFNELWAHYSGLFMDMTKIQDSVAARAACRAAFYKLEYKNKDPNRNGYEIAECVNGDRT
jgi:hypothetical protein